MRSFFEPDLDDAADAGVVAGLDIAVSVWLSKAWEYGLVHGAVGFHSYL